MKTLNEILDNYKDYAVVLDDRFGSRLAKFFFNRRAVRKNRLQVRW